MKTMLYAGISLMLFGATSAWAGGDAAAGEAIYNNICGECHFEDDFSGVAEEEIMAKVKSVVAGEMEHDEDLSGLSEEEIANISAFYAAN